MINPKFASFYDVTLSGYVSDSQAMYLWIFIKDYPRAYSHRKATQEVFLEFGKYFPARNSRISELEQMGFLRKVDTELDELTGFEVTRWAWTGRETALLSKESWVSCPHCEGKGGRVERVYIQEGQLQGDLFV